MRFRVISDECFVFAQLYQHAFYVNGFFKCGFIFLRIKSEFV